MDASHSGRASHAPLQTGGSHAILGLIVGEALIHQLVNESVMRERRELKILLGLLCGLLVPIGAAVVRAVGCLLGRELLKFELANEPVMRERSELQILLGLA